MLRPSGPPYPAASEPPPRAAPHRMHCSNLSWRLPEHRLLKLGYPYSDRGIDGPPAEAGRTHSMPVRLPDPQVTINHTSIYKHPSKFKWLGDCWICLANHSRKQCLEYMKLMLMLMLGIEGNKRRCCSFLQYFNSPFVFGSQSFERLF